MEWGEGIIYFASDKKANSDLRDQIRKYTAPIDWDDKGCQVEHYHSLYHYH